MTKKEIVFPFIIFALTIAFAVISLLLFLSGGKSAKLIARKMKIGALLLGFSATASSCWPTHTCYAPPAQSFFHISNANDKNEIIIDAENRKVTGGFEFQYSEYYTYAIADDSLNLIYQGPILPADGKFDSNHEDLEFTISKEVQPGKYNLLLYILPETKQNSNNYRLRYHLIVKE